MKLLNQIALITGGSRGIGRATGLLFAREGADIAFCHLDDDVKAEETAAEIRACWAAAPSTVRSMSPISPRPGRLPNTSAAAFGPIDILFNNAGMNIRKPFEAYTEAEFDRIVNVHLKGMFFMAQAVYPAMVARGRGCIINIASQRGLKGAVNSAPYSAAKAGIIGLTRALSWEAAPKGVRVNAIAPGPIDTDLTATMDPDYRQAFIDALPAGRFGRPEEIAATALLLAGPEGGFLCRRDAVAERWRRDALARFPCAPAHGYRSNFLSDRMIHGSGDSPCADHAPGVSIGGHRNALTKV